MEKQTKTVMENVIPCWYELSWQESGPALILRAHKDFIQVSQPIPENAPVIDFLKEEFSFEKFIGSLEGNFGFDNALQRLPEKDGFTEFLIQIPALRKPTGRTCARCKGSGHEESIQKKCFMCRGTGKEFQISQKPAYAISASLNFFFHYIAESFNGETAAALPQLMTFSLITSSGEQGGSLHGEFSPHFSQWLKSLGAPISLPGITEAMKTAHFKMDPLMSAVLQARILENGYLHLDCSDGGSGLSPTHNARFNIENSLGYRFGSHNVDTPAQQITLLAGLAALNDLARKEIKQY